MTTYAAPATRVVLALLWTALAAFEVAHGPTIAVVFGFVAMSAGWFAAGMSVGTRRKRMTPATASSSP